MTKLLIKNSIAILMLLTLAFSSGAKAQSYMTQNQVNIIFNITTYSYSNNTYMAYNPYPGKSMVDVWGGMMRAMQARYDYAHNILSTEYRKLKNLELINIYNVEGLNVNRNAIIAYSEPNYSKVDFTIYANFSSWLTYITSIYQHPSIKQEITLLKAVNTELNRIKNNDPDNFYKSDRYKDLNSVLSDLKTINKDSISTLNWKYGLF